MVNWLGENLVNEMVKPKINGVPAGVDFALSNHNMVITDVRLSL